HGSVVQIRHALVVFFAFLENKDPHGLTRQNNRLQGVGQLVDVQDFHALKLGHLIQVEIVGDDLGLVGLGQLDQFEVHLADRRKIVFHDLDRDGHCLLETLQDIQPAAATVALERISRIGHQLQFAQNKLRNHQHAVKETGFGDVSDAPVNDHAGVQDLEALAPLLLRAEDSAE